MLNNDKKTPENFLYKLYGSGSDKRYKLIAIKFKSATWRWDDDAGLRWLAESCELAGELVSV